MRKLIGGTILALPLVGCAVVLSVGSGVWWAGPAMLAASVTTVALFALGFYLLDG